MVLLWDTQPLRLQLIHRIVAECGVQPNWIETPSTIQHRNFSHTGDLAVVALGACPPASTFGLEAIHSLSRQGVRVICYEDGAQTWPLSRRCQLLLAGSSWLLDSAKAEFAQELRDILAQRLRAEARRRDEEERVKCTMRKIGSVGESRAIMDVFQTICRVSPLSDLPILITGETGTGKELLAHAVHQLDPKRCHNPFIAVNCSAISPGIAESELFGHRRGSFTGAERDRKGLIRSAEGGVLFLDEIGELDEALQAKLLRVLQGNRILGVGEEQELSVNVRMIAATNRDLGAMVRQGRFRADLFHRLNVLAVHIPPLRERPVDLKPLVEHFLEKYRMLKPSQTIAVAPDFIDALTRVELPGNARQLENLVRWALVNKDEGSALNLSDFPADIWQQLSEPENSHTAQSGAADAGHDIPHARPEMARSDFPFPVADLLERNGWNLSRSLQFCERLLLEAALQKARGNQSQTARLLGITPRSIYNKMHKHQLGS
jgi:two-component system, NtrC family, response regulator HydG